MQSILYPEQHRSVLPIHPTALRTLLARRTGQLQTLLGALPPSGLVLLSSFAIQAGTAISKQLFEALGSTGAAFLCHAVAAVLMLFLWRPRLANHRLGDYVLVAGLGLAIAGMSLAFYGAIARIPLGVASTLDFVGPLSVAILGSRRWLDLSWVLLAAIGVMLLTPLGGAALDPLGVALALLSAASWAIFILVSAPVGQAFPRGAGLSLAMAIAVVGMMPLGVQQAGIALLNPSVWGVATAVALLSVVLPYALEFKALNRMPPRVFGVLVSIEPAIAALVGFLFLKEPLELRSLIAIVLVSTASIGVTLAGRHDSGHS